jgi:2'-5' RNA ligase
MRSFIAINLPATVKTEIGEIIGRLRTAGPPARWVPAENLHVTIKFLDEISEDQVRPLIGAITAASGQTKPFELRLGGFGFFPNEHKSRVFWIGIESGFDVLKELARNVDHQTTPLGFAPEKRAFSAHITLARFRQPAPAGKLAAAAAHLDYHSEPIQVKGIDLMQSMLSPKGAAYSVLGSVPLK